MTITHHLPARRSGAPILEICHYYASTYMARVRVRAWPYPGGSYRPVSVLQIGKVYNTEWRKYP